MTHSEQELDSDQFGRVLAEYMLRIDRGEGVDRERFLQEHPEVADELREYFADLDTIGGALGGKAPDDRGRRPQPAAADGPVADGSLELRREFGSYVLLEKLGGGGMGEVYRARHRTMERIVAIKTIHPKLLDSPDAVRRFQREVKAAGRLTHPNIVKAYDAGEVEGVPFLAMEYVEGTDLSSLVKEHGPLPLDQALDCILQAARGLAYAHQHGVVHRDIKPANILCSVVRGHSSVVNGPWPVDSAPRHQPPGHRSPVTDDRSPILVKILDLGLARLSWPVAADGLPVAERHTLTGSGRIMGTVDYMAPEQAIDVRHADARADIYSLGSTLWYLLTGEPMYAGRTNVARLVAHQTKPMPSLRDACPAASSALEAVFRRMVAKNPEDRYQTMAEVIAALEPLLPGPPVALLGTPSSAGSGGDTTPRLGVPSRATRSSAWRGWRKAAAGAGGLLLILLGVWLVVRDREGNEVARIRLPEHGSISHEPDRLGSGAQSPPRRVPTATESAAAKTATPSVAPPSAASEPSSPPLPPWDLPAGAPPPAIAPFDAAQAQLHQTAWALYLGVEIQTANSLGMRFVLIPPGEFDMGSTEAEIAKLLEQAKAGAEKLPKWIHAGLQAESPRHRVRIIRPFWLASHELTRGHFRRFVDDSGYRTEAERSGLGGWGLVDGQLRQDPRFLWNTDCGVAQTDDQPVLNVTWNDAIAFCLWLSEKGGEPCGLPSEIQWEYACRAGTTTAWYSGHDERTLKPQAWYAANAAETTHPVGQKLPNAWGLYDMHGNAGEWCHDWYGGPKRAPLLLRDLWASLAGSSRAVRGGSWEDAAALCRASCRWGLDAGWSKLRVGFRIARPMFASPAGKKQPEA